MRLCVLVDGRQNPKYFIFNICGRCRVSGDFLCLNCSWVIVAKKKNERRAVLL